MKVHAPQMELPKICGIIVTYQPAHTELLRLVEAVQPQVDWLLVIDNGDGSTLPHSLQRINLDVLCLGENLGIARAQNVGIAEALSRRSDFILLLDQDSIPAADMVQNLSQAYRALKAKGEQVAALGPAYVDQRQGEASPFVYREGFKLRRRGEPDLDGTSPTDFLIASGCLIPVEVLDTIGLMTDELFIDYVDIEWGLRAQMKGYRSFGVRAAGMAHALGDDWIEFYGRRVPLHSPLRHYYSIRNAIWLAKRSWIGWPWRWILLRRMIAQFLFFSFFAPLDRGRHARLMLRGMWDGIRGRMGRFDDISQKSAPNWTDRPA